MITRAFVWLAVACGAAGAPARGEQAATTRPAALSSGQVAEHVVIIGLDGARGDAIRDHAGPAIRSLVARGTVSWDAQAVVPSVTQCNWASVLTGCLPARHGIDKHPVTQEMLRDERVKIPTLFERVAADEGKTALGFLGHWKLYPNETTAPRTRIVRSFYEAARVAPVAAAEIVRDKPTLTFVYFGDLDGIGHREGWMSEAYLKGIAGVDRGVGLILEAIDRAGMTEKTAVLITSDHGGHGKSHGEGTAEDLTIPWIVAGPGVRKGFVIERAKRELSTTDTAPTVLGLLGMKIPAGLDGTVVDEAFEPRKSKAEKP